MLTWLKNRRNRRETARNLYGAIVTQARDPSFYTVSGVADTMEGRFELIALHLYLTLHRLHGEPAPAADLAEDLTTIFVEDLDRASREMGVADLKVGKKVQKLARAAFERVTQYRAARSQGPAAMADALHEYLYDNAPDRTHQAASLADYTSAVAAHLQDQPLSSLLAGMLAFPKAPDGRAGLASSQRP